MREQHLNLCVSLVSGGEDLGGRGRVQERLSNLRACSVEPSNSSESNTSLRTELEGLEGSAQAALARLAEGRQVRVLMLLPVLG